MKVSPYILLATTALAHGDEHDSMPMSMPMDSHNNSTGSSSGMGMDMDASPMSTEHSHGRPVLEDPHLEPQQRKYWKNYNTTTFFTAEQGNKFNLYTHAALVFVSFGLLAPLNLLLSLDRRTQWLYIPLQTVQTSLGFASFLFLGFYATSVPDLYPGNAYSGFTLAMLVLGTVHWLAMIIKSVSPYLSLDGNQVGGSYAYMGYGNGSAATDEEATLTLNEDAEAFALDDISETRQESLMSTEYGSGSDTEMSSFDTERNPNKQMFTKKDPQFYRAPPSLFIKKLASNKVFAKLNSFMGRVASVVYHSLNIPMFLVGWAYVLTGIATAFLMGKDWRIFALLAHFIKGFVFFTLGFFELARFFGAGASRGWAWNTVVVRTPSASAQRAHNKILCAIWPQYPTIEFIQCFLIFFYGATNVFLEHLGNTDGAWSHKDLQHASIAFIFFSGGLCGMILESRSVRRRISLAFHAVEETQSESISRSWSMNPMPAFIIFWTGALMSHHHQETELATQIHMQWGYLFSLAAVLRFITLGLLSTKPHCNSEEDGKIPQKPFTEVLVSFCLICGGMIFMCSNRETVEGMIYRGIDQMFSMNVSVGVTVLLMAIFTGCIAIKGWASSRYL